MRVVATARCFYKGLREKGDIFDCDLEELPPFMEAGEPVVSKKPTAKKKAAKTADVAPDDGPDVAPNVAPDTPVSE